MTGPDARDLVRRAQAGDARAFEALYRANVGRVHALCLRLECDAERAVERTQDVFVRAWRKLGSFRGESAFSTWLHRVTVNVVLEEWRARRRRELVIEPLDEIPEPRAVPAAPYGAAVDLERAIAALPAGARAIFVLHDVEGYGHAEIADLLGLAVGTSKAQLFRARRLLREALNR